MSTQTSSKRIEYIDALRGFTMILVVFSHISQPDISPLNKLFITFRMPLFFFVSGYITYKANEMWNLTNVASKIIKKVKIQLIPTIIFGVIYTYAAQNSDLTSFIQHPYKFGYWFTLVLLEIFIIYYLFYLIFNKLHPNIRGGAFYIFSFLLMAINAIDDIRQEKIFDIFCLSHLFAYIQFFALGTLARQHQAQTDKLINNKYIIFTVYILFIATYIIIHTAIPTNAMFDKGLDILKVGVRYLGLIIVYAFFRKYQSSFSKNTIVGNSLQYIGKHTLDIYLLHYFFIPNLSPFRNYIFSSPNIVFELFFGVGVALMVIAVCLLVSKVLRTSDLLAHYLFGAKIKKEAN